RKDRLQDAGTAGVRNARTRGAAGNIQVIRDGPAAAPDRGGPAFQSSQSHPPQRRTSRRGSDQFTNLLKRPRVNHSANVRKPAPPSQENPMRASFLISVLLVVGDTAVTAWGADLTKIDRTIAKEPAYQSKPKYCLLVFGPEAKTRVWLVLEGDTLYVDRNGNGDLTEKGERFVLALDEYDRKRGKRVWNVGDIEAAGGKVRYTELQVSEISEAAHAVTGLGAGYGVSVKVPIAGHRVLQGVGGFVYPHHGFRLQFAARAQDAPIIHFGGPLRMILLQPQRLAAGMK